MLVFLCVWFCFVFVCFLYACFVHLFSLCSFLRVCDFNGSRLCCCLFCGLCFWPRLLFMFCVCVLVYVSCLRVFVYVVVCVSWLGFCARFFVVLLFKVLVSILYGMCLCI